MKITKITQANQISTLINKNFPHISTSRNFMPLTNILEKNIDCLDISPQIVNTKRDKLKKIVNWHINLSKKLNTIRNTNRNETQKWIILKNILSALKKEKVGNCYEEAVVAAGICEINGIKAYVAQFAKGSEYVDHAVCIFNKSGKPIENKITNNDTIIIDPWLDVVDYAKNYIAKNEAQLGELVHIPKDGKYRINTIFDIKIPKEGIEYFKKNYPQLFLKYKI